MGNCCKVECTAFMPLSMLNRILVLVVGSLAYCSWSGLLNIFYESKWLGTIEGKVLFTIMIFTLMFLLAMWYLKKSEKLREAAAELLEHEPAPDSDSEDEEDGGDLQQASLTRRMARHTDLIGAAALLQGFGNLTDAMGYMLAEIWIEELPKTGAYWLQATSLTVLCCGVLLVMEIFEKRLSIASRTRATLHTFGQVGVGSFAWFVSTPVEAMWYAVFGIAMDAGRPPIWLWYFSMMGAIIFVALANVFLANANCCHLATDYTKILLKKVNGKQDQIEDLKQKGHGLGVTPEEANGAGATNEVRTPLNGQQNGEAAALKDENGKMKNLPTTEDVAALQQHLMLDALFCEKAIAMLKATSFFSSARILRSRVLSRTATADDLTELFWMTFGFYFVSVILSIVLEQLVACLPRSEDKKSRLLAQKFGTEAVELVVRTLGWIAAKLTTNFYSALFNACEATHPRIFWLLYAIISQLLAILVEEWRHWKLPKLKAKLARINFMKQLKKAEAGATSSSEESGDE